MTSFEFFEIDEVDIRNLFSEFIPEFTISLKDAGSWQPKRRTGHGLVDGVGFYFKFKPQIMVILDYGMNVIEQTQNEGFIRKLEDIKIRLEGMYNASIKTDDIFVEGTQVEIIIYTDNNEKV
jgi:hypothetical protein